MRRLQKQPKPDILVANEDEWIDDLLHANPPPSNSVVASRYGASEIRAALSHETFNKCAYCESLIGAVSYPHVEHIRPKNLHKHLTFEWSNLTLACQVCNTKKGVHDVNEDNFVHPYDQNPEEEFHFAGAFMGVTANNSAARLMRNWLDLNRADLVVLRLEVIQRVESIYLEAVSLRKESRRPFIDLSLPAITSADKQFSRVAVCAVKYFETEYGDLID